jgi:hypothetical protein
VTHEATGIASWLPTIYELSGKFRVSGVVEDKTYLGPGNPLSMTSEVMDSNFPFSDTADVANDR